MNNKRLRILHSAALLRPPSGILNQMQWEQEAASDLDIPWVSKMYCSSNTAVYPITHFDEQVDANKLNGRITKLISWFKLRLNYHQWLMSLVDEYDVFVLRYYVHDPFQLWFISNCPKPVYLVHHTLEVPEMYLAGGLGGFIRAKLEVVIGKQCINKAFGLIGVTEEIVSHERERIDLNEKRTLIYPNGIVYSSGSILDEREGEIPELLFVANFASWHGLDLLLVEIFKSKENFILHLVGQLLPEDLVNAKRDNRVIVHGKLSHLEITKISQRCWLGLSSFGLNRKHMLEACPLKTREYLMTGLPVYADHKDVFPKDFPYFKQGQVDFLDILNFAKKMRLVSKLIVRQASKPYISKDILLSQLYQAFTTTFTRLPFTKK